MPQSLVQRTLTYLRKRVNQETEAGDFWAADDYQIAFFLVLYLKRKLSNPYVHACIKVTGCHPNQLWFRIWERQLNMYGQPQAFAQSFPHFAEQEPKIAATLFTADQLASLFPPADLPPKKQPSPEATTTPLAAAGK